MFVTAVESYQHTLPCILHYVKPTCF